MLLFGTNYKDTSQKLYITIVSNIIWRFLLKWLDFALEVLTASWFGLFCAQIKLQT